MTRGVLITPFALALASAVSGCEAQNDGEAVSRFDPDYKGVETRLLDGDLVNFHVSMAGARTSGDVDAYAPRRVACGMAMLFTPSRPPCRAD